MTSPENTLRLLPRRLVRCCRPAPIPAKWPISSRVSWPTRRASTTKTSASTSPTVEAAAATRLARLLDASPAVIYSFEAKGDFAPTFVSENIERLFGYAASEYLENPNFWRERVHPEICRASRARWRACSKQGKHVVEYRFRRKDGSYCWVNDDQHLMRDAKGAPSEIVGSWSDISARMAAEAAEDRGARAACALAR